MSAIILITGMAAVAPFFYSRYESVQGGTRVRRLTETHDLGMHLYTMEQFDKVLRSGVLYPRWVPDINHGYGILTLIYYPPGFFYLTSAVHAVWNDWLDTLFVVAALSLAASGFALYLLARTFYGVLASAVAAVFYMILPIHMLDLYWRGSAPQFVGYIFPPLVIYFAYKLGRESKPRYYAGLALFYAMHILTNLPVALMFTYALAFYVVVWAAKERDWRIGVRLAAAMALGLLLSAVYWLPAAVESKYAYEYASEVFPYHQSYITLLPVYNTKLFPDFYRALDKVFFCSALALLACVGVVTIIQRREQSAVEGRAKWTPSSMWIVMSIVTTFMCTSFSIYVSKLLPKMQVAVPAFRWLALAAMFGSLVIADAIDLLRGRSSLRPKQLLACGAVVVLAITGSLISSIAWAMIRPLSNPIHHPSSPSNVVESSWTPKGSTPPKDLPDTGPAAAESAGAAVEIAKWEPQERQVFVRADRPTAVRLKTYNFPGWIARVDGQVVPMLSDKDGVQRIEVPSGTHAVRATFENTSPRTAGALFSALGLLAMLALMLPGLFWLSKKKG